LAFVLAVGKATCRCNVVDISKRFRNAVVVGDKTNGTNAGSIDENSSAGKEVKFACRGGVAALAVALAYIAGFNDVISK